MHGPSVVNPVEERTRQSRDRSLSIISTCAPIGKGKSLGGWSVVKFCL